MKRLLIAIALALGVAHAATPTGKVTLSWTPSADKLCEDGITAIARCPITGYELQELVNGMWTIKKGVAATATSATFDGLGPGEEHCYRIRANSNGTFSQPSEQVCVKVPEPKYAPRTVQKITASAELITP